MKNEVIFKNPRNYVVFVLVAVFLSTSLFAVLASGAFSGGIFTTDRAGIRVNQNIFQNSNDVYLNGGPNNSTSQGLPPNEVFYFEVTDPSGNVLLSNDAAACRQVQTNTEGRVYGVFIDVAGCYHDVGLVDTSNGALPVQIWPFDRTPNSGGEYKVSLVKKNAPGVSIEPDGKHLDYPQAAAKSDNFKVVNGSLPTPTPTPSPTPTPTPIID